MSTEMWRPDFEDLDWSKHLATEMRFRGASDQEVADALTTAEAHCVDSGQPPEQAIGDPVQTATDLVGRRTAPFAYALRDSLPNALAVSAWLILVNLIGRPLDDRLHPTWLLLPVLVILWLVMPIAEALLMRLFPRTSATQLGIASLIVIVVVLLPTALYLDGLELPRMNIPAWAGWAVGAACLTGWGVARVRRIRRDCGDPRGPYLGVVALIAVFVFALLVSIF